MLHSKSLVLFSRALHLGVLERFFHQSLGPWSELELKCNQLASVTPRQHKYWLALVSNLPTRRAWLGLGVGGSL
jgi:hypothetical protein